MRSSRLFKFCCCSFTPFLRFGLLAGGAERTAARVLLLVELLRKLLLLLVELAGLAAHLGHFLGELVGRLLAKLVAELVQLPAGARAFGHGLRKLALLQRLRRLLHVRAALFHLLAGVLRLLLDSAD